MGEVGQLDDTERESAAEPRAAAVLLVAGRGRLATYPLRGGAPLPLGVGESFHIGPFSFVVLDAAAAADSDLASIREQLVVAAPTPAGVPAVVREIAASEISVLVLGETGELARWTGTLGDARKWRAAGAKKAASLAMVSTTPIAVAGVAVK